MICGDEPLDIVSSKCFELDQIHRFRNEWEAAASLKLRHGDPTGLQPYLDHDRIHAAPFTEHCENIAHAWTGARTRGEHIAVTTTSLTRRGRSSSTAPSA